MKPLLQWLLLGSAATLFGAAGCTTESFCFDNCEDGISGLDGGGGGGEGGRINIQVDGGDCVGLFCPGAEQDGSDCVLTNEGIEICDDIDNDCDGEIDEASDIDFTQIQHCGNCDLNCNLDLIRVEDARCNTDNIELGRDPGQCEYDTCSDSFSDVDGDPSNGCEYFCQWNPDGTNTTDPGGADGCGKDDDCDGEIDEDVNVCDDTENCGECGRRCVLPNATAVCSTSAAAGEECDTDNTRCQIDTCDAGFFDVDGSASNGCEYECTITNNGVEICDGLDNDCDRKIDNADADLENEEPQIGQSCQGGDKGVCADPANAGVYKCIGAQIRCCDVDSNNREPLNTNFPPAPSVRNGVCEGDVGPFVIVPGEFAEKCDNVDHDCDGNAFVASTEGGGVCGTSVGTCEIGTFQCIGGSRTCVGQTVAVPEVCDGFDNDCDGIIDGTLGTGVACTIDDDCLSNAPYTLCRTGQCVQPPTDVVDRTTNQPIACDVPPTPPAGVPQPCQAGTYSCLSGQRVCTGSITKQQETDDCGEDTNCDGQLTDQTGLGNDDVLNCGDCGNDCNALGANVEWLCSSGQCVRNECKPGFIECDPTNPDDCETSCTFTSSVEFCDGIDNDCDCTPDDNPQQPTVVEACGVDPAATDPGCTTLVTMQCVSGGWECTFPPDYCPGGDCTQATELCDDKDNDCDGFIDEDFRPPNLTTTSLGATCQSDDGVTPKHGPCQTIGVYECDPATKTTTVCSAQKDETRATAEICDGVDNDCDGLIDAADPDITNDPDVGVTCQGGTLGVCADPANSGTTACVNGSIACQGPNVVRPGDLDETCNTLDDDCDGTADEIEDLVDDGSQCGSSTGQCVPGIEVCTAGTLTCQGGVPPGPEVCNGLDDDCDGVPDNALTDTGAVCEDRPAPCQPGTTQCTNPGTTAAALECVGAILPSSTVDACGEDSNCDGQLTNQPDFQNDVENCGGCGNDCNVINAGKNGIWDCQSGGCVLTGCQPGFINCQAPADTCETACPNQSGTELCNGLDDDCNCVVDDVPLANTPSPVQVCGVSSTATDPNCLGNVSVQCVSGGWQCTFPAGYCDQGSPASCSSTGEPCDGSSTYCCDDQDNNCNGVTDENAKAPARQTKPLNASCTSEDLYRDLQCATSGDPLCPPIAPPHGVCSGSGVYQCTADDTDTICTATFDSSAAGEELCDSVDNDCDGLVDETFNNPGSNATFFVKPEVVQIGSSLWVYQYEASRPDATANSQGSGNGYYCSGGSTCTVANSSVPSAPSGVTLDQTPACSIDGKVPWSNVTPVEVEQTCAAMGGVICDLAEWQTACEAQASCLWGYTPSCQQPADGTRFCNLHDFDFNTGVTGIQDGLLPTASPLLNGCFANWSGTFTNGAGDDQIFDITGNLREITKLDSTNYTIMGGAFNSQSEDGARCDFDFFAVTDDFKLFDTGFRCCFTSDPRQ